MSTTPISSLLSNTGPTPSAVPMPTDSSKEFDRFLQKAALPATTAEKPAAKREPESPQSQSAHPSESVNASEQEQAESSDERGETDTAAEDQPVAKSESIDTNEQIDDNQDELVLSEAAVAVTALQNGETKEPEANTEETILEADTEGSDQKQSEQPNTESALETLPADKANPKKQQSEKSPVDQEVSAEKPQNPVTQASNLQARQIAEQAPQSLETPSDTQVSQVEKLNPRLQGKTSEQPELQPGEQPPAEKNSSETSIAVQRPAFVVDGATDNGQRTTDNPSPNSSAGPSPINGAVQQIVPPVTQQTGESLSAQPRSEPAVPTVDRGRFVQRVANAFRSAQQNNGEIQLRLSPPELGSLKIEIAVRNGVLTAKLETESADARRVLLDNLPALRHRLAEQDIRIEKFDVDVRRDGGQGQSGAEDRQSRDGSNRDGAANRNRISTKPEVTTSRVPRSKFNTSPDSLDVRI